MDMKENNKKQQILLAAVEIMSKRGKDASITEIARAASVDDLSLLQEQGRSHVPHGGELHSGRAR